MEIKLLRIYQVPLGNPKETLGILEIIDENKIIYTCKTLELPWLDNKRGISCIPKGIYKCVFYNSPSKGEALLIKDVKDRSYIEIHKGNYNSQIRGCVLVGSEWKDINSDGIRDVINSGKTLDKILEILKSSGQKEFEIEILWR